MTASHPSSDGKPKTILVVEDAADVCELTSEMLQRAGFHVLQAANGYRALELWREHGPSIDLLLIDVMMPEMSGVQLVERIKQSRRDIKVLYMSGYPAHPSRGDALVDTETPLLTKPFTMRALKEMVQQVLDA